MIGITVPVAAPTLTRLDWECQHFGLSAIQLAPAELDDVALVATLQLARRQGAQLLVWPANGGRDVPQVLLQEFGGALVDRKVTFRRALQPLLASENSSLSVDFPVIPYPSTTPSAALIELAISAGIYSRFHVDRHFPHQAFEAMYRRWIERSVAMELADKVLAVPLGHQGLLADGPLAGMITLSEAGGVASIGLVAVATAARGKGIGMR